MRYFDSHAHYYDERFRKECEEGVDALLTRLFAESVSGIVNVGTSPETCRAAIRQTRRYPAMYTALGIHPTDGQLLDDPDAALSEVENMILDPENKCVALGEIGLDYHYPDTDKEKQAYLFDRQMELAARLDLPVVIHDREAHGDVMETILRHKKTRGVLHSFSGSPEMAEELVRLGYFISFSGTLTFQNARRTVESAAKVPPEKILIETDCPYLAPHPLRGTLNHSGNLAYTAARLAGILGTSPETAARLTEENARRFFSLEKI
ncbi:MAG TPA: hydrolase TatD [Clostridiales bacterium]|nr:hydrolase TatD [Clostridiales bacterium]